MQEISITYEIFPASSPISVRNVLEIRSASKDSNGRYVTDVNTADPLYVFHQLGLLDLGEKAQIYFQPPEGIYLPDSGYGPRPYLGTRAGVLIRSGRRRITTTPSGGNETFVKIDTFGRLAETAINNHCEDQIRRMLSDKTFREALCEVFGSAGMRFEPEKISEGHYIPEEVEPE